MSMLFGPDKTLTVSQISRVIKEMLEGTLNSVKVEGEISNLKKASSGHIYFDLKDEGALLHAVLFKGYATHAGELKEGSKIVVSGDISCYVKSGRYQIIAKQIEISKKKGDLREEFEKLKAKLAAEGLFDPENKKPLPRFPERIGVITSPTGAAVRDILSVLKRGGGSLEIIIAPVLVQGEGSKEQITQALKNLNKLKPSVDVILLGRGGGSIEDLWSFNEEEVARAVAASKAPVISCVGHETDFTLTDFAADTRAPTPSAAAELVIENSKNTISRIMRLRKLLAQTIALICLRKEQSLDDLTQCLENAAQEKLSALARRAQLLTQKILLLDPASVLKRGYSITRRVSDGEIAQSSSKGERLKIQTAKSVFEAQTI
jgi:exodeoxyribonuclease VII large subunit